MLVLHWSPIISMSQSEPTFSFIDPVLQFMPVHPSFPRDSITHRPRLIPLFIKIKQLAHLVCPGRTLGLSCVLVVKQLGSRGSGVLSWASLEPIRSDASLGAGVSCDDLILVAAVTLVWSLWRGDACHTVVLSWPLGRRPPISVD